jgi:hypothetical protein
VSIDFAYAQARVQARLGERLSETGWRALESTLGLPQYLASVRNTALARYVQHFSATLTPHTIERSLRDDWRAEVDAVRHWVPDAWSPAVAWATWLPYLDALAWLAGGGAVLPWMQADAVLSVVAMRDVADRKLVLGNAAFGILADDDTPAGWHARWFDHWTSLYPKTRDDEKAGLRLLVAAIRRYFATIDRPGTSRTERREASERLEADATGLVHRRAETPVVMFCHLSLVALDLQRLRDGLLRRALFRDETAEQAA